MNLSSLLQRFTLFLYALLFLFLTGCAGSTAGIAVSNIPLENKKYTVLGPAETMVSWVSFDVGFLGFPLEPPPVDEAVRRLLESKGGDALINLRYATDRSVYLFITYHRFFLKADVVKLEK